MPPESLELITAAVVCLIASIMLGGLAIQRQKFNETGIHTLFGPWKLFYVSWRDVHSWEQTFPDAWVEIRTADGRTQYLNSLGSRKNNPKVGTILFEIIGPSDVPA